MSENLGYLEGWWLGGIYSPNHQFNRWGGCLSMGAPDSPMCHQTLSGAPATSPNVPTVRVLTVSTVGALTSWGTGQSGVAPDSPVSHRTGAVHCPVCLLTAALTLREPSAHCSTFAVVCCSRPLRWSRCSAGAPDSPVNYSEARSQKPEGEEFEVDLPSCIGHCPVAHRTVRCARPGSSSVSFCSFLLNHNLNFLLVCVEPLAPVEHII
jgi:hypothetical protein